MYWGLQMKLLEGEVEPERVFSGLVPAGEEGNMKEVLSNPNMSPRTTIRFILWVVGN
jgi:hypothetical protein